VTLLFALLLAAADPADGATSHATVPLEEYERLRKLDERPSITVVDLLRVEGSFSRRDLSVTLTGRAAGTWPTAEVLAAEGVRLHSCEGDALLSRSESGAFAVTPLAQRFRVRCKLALDGNDRLEGETTRAVLEVAAAVQDGELVASAGDGGGRGGAGPADAPPRPGTVKYDEFMKERERKRLLPASERGEEAKPAPAAQDPNR